MESLLDISVPKALGTIAIAWVVYIVAQAIHRLYFSPIAKFPGPKLAAVSLWYATESRSYAIRTFS